MEEQTPSIEEMLFTVFILMKWKMEEKVLLPSHKYTISHSLYIFMIQNFAMWYKKLYLYDILFILYL